MGKKRKRAQEQHEGDATTTTSYQDYTEPEIEGAHLYSNKNQLPWDLTKYWNQRHSIFSLYDNGIWVTDDSWFEVTHECIAKEIASHVAASKPKDKVILLDCFAGIGGNAIAFALSGYKRVYAIEKNMAALECARHNARIYGVHDKITFFHGDCFEILGLDDERSGKKINDLVAVIRKAGIIFASPPWGGTGYKDAEVMDLESMPYGLKQLQGFAQISTNVVLYLPRNSDVNQIADCVEDGRKSQIVHYCMQQNSKALCAYLGEWSDIAT